MLAAMLPGGGDELDSENVIDELADLAAALPS
jgi:hypothetical protein